MAGAVSVTKATPPLGGHGATACVGALAIACHEKGVVVWYCRRRPVTPATEMFRYEVPLPGSTCGHCAAAPAAVQSPAPVQSETDAKLAALLVIAMRAEAAGEKGSCAGAQTSQSCARAGGARRSTAAAAAAQAEPLKRR